MRFLRKADISEQLTLTQGRMRQAQSSKICLFSPVFVLTFGVQAWRIGDANMAFKLAEFMSSGSLLTLEGSFLKHLKMIQYSANCSLVYIHSGVDYF